MDSMDTIQVAGVLNRPGDDDDDDGELPTPVAIKTYRPQPLIGQSVPRRSLLFTSAPPLAHGTTVSQLHPFFGGLRLPEDTQPSLRRLAGTSPLNVFSRDGFGAPPNQTADGSGVQVDNTYQISGGHFPASPGFDLNGDGKVVEGGGKRKREDGAYDQVNDTVADTIEVKPVVNKPKRHKKVPAPPPTALRRYSARTQTFRTATAMDRVWNLLPPEIQMTVWDAAVPDKALARIVLISNRSSPWYDPGLLPRNDAPAISRVSHQARLAFLRVYRKMFGRIPIGDSTWHDETRLPMLPSTTAQNDSPPIQYVKSKTIIPMSLKSIPFDASKFQKTALDEREKQWVNSDLDIVMLEPCCEGCRANYCMRKQFTEGDRKAVRFLALKGEPAWPAAMNVAPCWVNVSAVFPNVETLYLDTLYRFSAPKIKHHRAMVRVKESGLNLQHQQRFEDWKKGDGKNKTLSKIVFVAVYPPQNPPRWGMDSCPERIGAPVDIIIG